MHKYTDPGSGAMVFVPSPEVMEINRLKDRVEALEILVLVLVNKLGVDVNAII